MVFRDGPCSLDNDLTARLALRDSRGLRRNLTTPARHLVDFSSNDYLSLSQDPEIQQQYLRSLNDAHHQGSFSLGSGGSRLLDGNSTMAESLEQSLANFHCARAGLLFNSGYEANVGLLSCVTQTQDIIILDELVHASVHSGVRLSRAARRLHFRHNCVWKEDEKDNESTEQGPASHGTLRSLDSVLSELLRGYDGHHIRDGTQHVFIAVEAVYSMEGDLAPLSDIVRCIEHQLPRGNGHLIVDEAHSNGIFGERGRGLVCELGLEKRVWVVVHTFGKALGCSGAIILCSNTTRDYLINYARPFIYTTAMAYPTMLSLQVAHLFVAGGQADANRDRLRNLIRHFKARLTELYARLQKENLPPGVIRLSDKHTSSALCPIIPIFSTRARSLAKHCQSKGYMVRAIVAPTVPQGKDMVRVCLHARNCKQECDTLCNAIEEWVGLQTMATSAAVVRSKI